MTVRVINPPAAMHVETARCLFAIELSKQSWVIGFITPFSSKISRRTLNGGGNWKGLLKLIEEVQTRVSREAGRAVDAMSCYEAGYDGFGCTGSLRRMAYAITSSIQQASRWIAGRGA